MFHKDVVRFSIQGIDMIGNCNNGSIIGLSSDGIQFLDKLKQFSSINDIEACNLSANEVLLFNALKSQGYFDILPKETTEAVYFHLNNDCNLHCLGCYSHNAERNSGKNLSYSEICIALSKLKELGMRNIIISGGEPFLREDIYDILKYIKVQLSIPAVQVITNGTLTGRYDTELLSRYVDELNISIDGYSEEFPSFIRDKGIYNTIMNNIGHLKEKKVCIKLIATLHRKNIDAAGEYISLSQKLGIPISFSILTCSGDFDGFEQWLPTPEQLKRYGYGEIKGLDKVYSSAKGSDFILSARKTCGMGQRLISIANDGSIYPCHMAQVPAFSLGNIVHDKISCIQERCANFSHNVDVTNVKACLGCEYKFVCGGGCRARAITMYGDPQAPDDYCIINKTYFETVISHLKEEINS